MIINNNCRTFNALITVRRHIRAHRRGTIREDGSENGVTGNQAGAEPSPLQDLLRVRRQRLKQSEQTIGAFVCDLCFTVCKNKQSLYWHKKGVHAEKSITCGFPGCGTEFKTRGSLNRHVNEVHKKLKRSTKTSQKFVCPVEGCNRSYASIAALRTHARKVHEPNPPQPTFVCELCSKAFRYRYSLTQHKKRVHHSQSFKCNVPGCGRTYKSHHTLKMHVKDFHENHGQVFPCPFKGCLQTFAQRSNVYRHVRRAHR